MPPRPEHGERRHAGLTLLEVVIALSILVIGLLGLVTAAQRSADDAEQATLAAQQQLFAESVLAEAQRTQLTTLYGLCGTDGLIVRAKAMAGYPANPYPQGLVAVLQCRDPATDASFAVDPASAGLSTTSQVRVVRVRVRTLFVSNPDETDPTLLSPLPGSRFPAAADLVSYRIAS